MLLSPIAPILETIKNRVSFSTAQIGALSSLALHLLHRHDSLRGLQAHILHMNRRVKALRHNWRLNQRGKSSRSHRCDRLSCEVVTGNTCGCEINLSVDHASHRSGCNLSAVLIALIDLHLLNAVPAKRAQLEFLVEELLIEA